MVDTYLLAAILLVLLARTATSEDLRTRYKERRRQGRFHDALDALVYLFREI